MAVIASNGWNAGVVEADLVEGFPTLTLSEEEAFALLGLCMTSPQKLDANAEVALRKLADYCVAVSGIPNKSKNDDESGSNNDD